jgi:hypothetical protein
MPNMRLITVAASLLIVFNGAHSSATAENAKWMNAKQMVDVCTSAPLSLDDVICSAFMSGFAQASFATQESAATKEACIPNHFSGDEVRAIFIRFMKGAENNRAVVELPLGPLLWFAIAAQFPCRKQ